MDRQRAREIASSPKMIDVSYDGRLVYTKILYILPITGIIKK